MNNNQFSDSIAKIDRYKYFEFSKLFFAIGSILLIPFTMHALSIVHENYDLKEKTRLIQSENRPATNTKLHLLTIEPSHKLKFGFDIDNQLRII
jgi:hypothetical protein